MEINTINRNLFFKLDFLLNRKGLFFFIFSTLIVLFILNRIQIYLNVSLNYVDSDQPFMWAGAIDYSKGIFHEPRFYGQNYNSFFEGLVAVPFIWFGLPVYKALPIATQCIFLFPFLFSSIFLCARGQKVNALLVLASVMCMTTGFDIMTSIPRGFVTGVFFSSFFVVSFVNPNDFKMLMLNGVMLLLGYYINPNSVLISAPFLAYLMQFHYKNKKFYWFVLGMMVLFVLLYFVFDYFYKVNPSYVIYGYEHDFSFKYFLENLSHLHQAFIYISFFREGQAWIVILCLFILGLNLYNENRKAFYAFIVFLCFVLLAFFSGKSRDGAEWPWYAYSRVHICIPATLFLFTSIFKFKENIILAVLVLVVISFASFKLISFDKELQKLTNEKLWNGVHLVPMETTLKAVQLYKDYCKKEEVDFLLVSNGFWLNTYLDYGGQAIDKSFPNTLETRAERRYWQRGALNNQTIKKFVFISVLYDLETYPKQQFKLKRLDDYGLYLVYDNQLKTEAFINWANKTELGL
jgi:hypothetical protein